MFQDLAERWWRVAAAVLVCLFLIGFGDRLHARSLEESLVTAYQTNPSLRGARARLKATEEELPRAKSGYRPTIAASADIGLTNLDTKPSSLNDGGNEPHGYSLTLSQPVFRGFRTVNSIKLARARISAARQDLRAAEQTVLLEGTRAYLNVIHDRAVLRLRQQNVRLLGRLLRGIKIQLDAESATKVDLSQAQASRAAAKARVSIARATLSASRAAFTRVFGYPPAHLDAPKVRGSLLPTSLKRAIYLAENESPQVLASASREQAARLSTKFVRGQLLPQIDIEASFERRYNSERRNRHSEEASVVGRVRIPIYQAGDVRAQVRQSVHNATGAFHDSIQTRLVARENLIRVWSLFETSRIRLASERIAVRAQLVAFDGVQNERLEGRQSTLDVLETRRLLVDAQVRLVTARRDMLLSKFEILTAVGRMNPESLGLPIAARASNKTALK